MTGAWQRCCRRLYPVGFQHEFVILLKVAGPVVATNLLLFFILTESIIMCGHLDTYQLGGSSLANSILNALGISVGTGLCTACDTLFSQVYGSPYRQRLGIYLQRSMAVISVFPFFLWILHLNCEPIFIFLGQDPQVAIIAADYMKVFTPGLFFSFHTLILARYMQNQDRVYAPMVCCFIGNVFNVVSQYIAIYVIGLSYRASAACEAMTFFVMWLCEVVYIVCSGLYKETWQGWSVEALYDWGQFVKLAMPGVGMITMETVSWEIGTFIAGMLGATWLAVQGVLFQLETITFMISFGLSVAVNIRVGQNLGGQDPQRAKTAYRVGVTTVLMSATITAIVFASLPQYLPRIFTNDMEVISRAGIIVQLLGLFQYVDGVGTVSAGALRGCGRQIIGAGFIFLAYYVFGLPIGISLALFKLKVLGLWIGIFIGLTVSVPCMVLVVNFQNWNRQAKLALERIRGNRGNAEAEDSETQMLLKDRRQRAKTENAPAPGEFDFAHRRTPSLPMGPSIPKLVPLKDHRDSLQSARGVIILRILTYLFAILMFAGGLALSLLLPRDLYLPDNFLNITTTVSP